MDGNGTIGLLDEQLSPSFESQVEIDDVDAFPMITENADQSNLNAVARRDEIRTNIVLSKCQESKIACIYVGPGKECVQFGLGEGV